MVGAAALARFDEATNVDWLLSWSNLFDDYLQLDLFDRLGNRRKRFIHSASLGTDE